MHRIQQPRGLNSVEIGRSLAICNESSTKRGVYPSGHALADEGTLRACNAVMISPVEEMQAWEGKEADNK